MKTFKVGDRVRVTGTNAIGFVETIEPDGSVWVMFRNVDSRWYEQQYLELVED